jgi:hypothetical protein
MLQSHNDRVEWYVIFSETKLDHWIYKLVSREMGHVYAVRSLNDYQWLVVNPRVNIVETKILLKCQYPTIYDISGIGDKVVRVSVKPAMRPRGTFNWFNCVEQVKALIGVRSFWTWTPKQLYEGLIGGRYE